MVKVAQIINTHGLKGECKCRIFTDDLDTCFKKGQVLYCKDTSLMVKSFRMQKGFGYVTFEQITSIEQAEAYKTCELMIDEEALPTPEEGRFYYFELMDCEVYNTEDEYLGKVIDILETGAQVILRIEKDDSNFLCPFVPAFIDLVDVENKEIVIREMVGLR